MRGSASPTQSTRRVSSCVPAMPRSWSAARTQPGRLRSPSPRMDGQVFLLVRADGLERSMARYLRDRIERDPKIEVLLGHQVRELSGDGHLEQVTIEDARTGEPRTLEASAMVVLIGAEPRTEWLCGQVALDDEGFVLTGPAISSSPARSRSVGEAGPRPVPGRNKSAWCLRGGRYPLRVYQDGRPGCGRRRHGGPLRRRTPGSVSPARPHRAFISR